MSFRFALIGPGKKVASMARNFLNNRKKWRHLGRLLAVTITDEHSIELDIPQYFNWQKMLACHHITTVINLDQNPALKQELRQNLSPEIDLVENIPELLLNQQEILQNILVRLPFPLIHTNLKGDIFFANRAAQDNFFSLFNNKTNNLFKLVPEILAHVSDYLAGFEIEGHLATGLSQNFILEINNDQWDVTCIIIPDEQNQNTAMIWILRNATMEETQNRLNAALAMSGAISHKLAQPLTAIVNSAQLIARAGARDMERIRRHQKIITSESKRIFKIYRELQNITQFKVQKYLDTQILDLEESSGEHLDFTFPESNDSQGRNSG